MKTGIRKMGIWPKMPAELWCVSSSWTAASSAWTAMGVGRLFGSGEAAEGTTTGEAAAATSDASANSPDALRAWACSSDFCSWGDSATPKQASASGTHEETSWHAAIRHTV